MEIILGIILGILISEFKHSIFKDGFISWVKTKVPFRWGP